MADLDLYLLALAEKRPDERLRRLFNTDLERELASFNNIKYEKYSTLMEMDNWIIAIMRK